MKNSVSVDLQNTTQKTKDRATRTAQKNGSELGCSGRIISSCIYDKIIFVSLIGLNALLQINKNIHVRVD